MSQGFIDLVRRGSTREIAAWVGDDPQIALSRDAAGVSALMWSIYSGQTTIRDFLLSGIPDLDLFEAAAAGNAARLASLLDAGGNVNAISSDGWPVLHLAAAFGTAETVTLLLDRGADVHQRSTSALRNHALHAALALSRDPEIIRLLLTRGADPNAPQHGGFTPLHQAAAAGRADLVEILLRAGADRHSLCDRGKTPAEFAREREHSEVLKLLEAARPA